MSQLAFSFGLAGQVRAAIERADSGDWARIVGAPVCAGDPGRCAGSVSRVLRAHLDGGLLDTHARRVACGDWVRELAGMV